MEIFAETIERELPDLAKQGVRTRFVGRRDRAPEGLRAGWRARGRAPRERRGSTSGSRSTTAAAPRSSRRRGGSSRAGSTRDEIDEDAFAAHLYAPELPDPDLLIRTSGELRISNFLLWQLAYAELVFVDTLWPDFGPRELRARARRVRAAAAAASAADDGRAQRLAHRLARARRRSRAIARVGLPLVLGRRLARRLVAVRARRSSAALVALHEFYAMSAPLRPLALAGYAGAGARSSSATSSAASSGCSAALLATLALAFLLKGLGGTRGRRPSRVGDDVLGAAWIGFGLGFVAAPARDARPRAAPLRACCSPSWPDDTFAYFGGPAARAAQARAGLSPGKTWEGFVVGTVARVFVAFVALYHDAALT